MKLSFKDKMKCNICGKKFDYATLSQIKIEDRYKKTMYTFNKKCPYCGSENVEKETINGKGNNNK